ncbi:Clp protease N-terminal domain-containing protein [Nocardia sp. NPDC050712]|uniref:Clp protease N-terminal domain-containing protein n=1 Tax=Nocardia sp. NPDC050712 TaxID=3155518 RepID=UPI0033E4A53F
MTTTAPPPTNNSVSPDSGPPEPPTRVEGWITAELEHVLQRAVDIANSAGNRQLRVEHVMLAALEDRTSSARAGWHATLTVTQWQKALLDALPARHVERDQPQQVTDIFCWRSSRN